MRIDEVTIENFRGIRAMKLPLDPRVNLFVGVNGSGKSTILDCVAILLARFIEQLQTQPSLQPRSIRPPRFVEDDITIGTDGTQIGITVTHGTHGTVRWSGGRRRDRKVPVARNSRAPIDRLVADIRQAISDHTDESIPIVTHYPVNRAVANAPSVVSKHAFEQLNALDQAMPGNFGLFFEWFRIREDIENEQFRKAHNAMTPQLVDWQDRQLGAVRAAIPRFLDGFKDLRIRRAPAPMRMMVTKGTEELALDQLSDGEKCMLALVGDLARRLAIANPTLPDPLDGSGVVLIDEVDLHLHPRWQRMIVPTLRDTFPRCQFLLTTHSPQIIAHVHPRNIRTLSREDGAIVWGQPTESFGMDSNRVLSELMGTDERPHDIKVRLEALFTRIGEGDLAGAREAAEALRSEIGVDPELVKADTVIRRRELIGR